MTEQYKGQTVIEFLEYANEATTKIREVNKLICGTEMPEDECLLGVAEYGIYLMIETFLAPIVKMEVGDDDLNDMTTEIMSAKKDEISMIIEKYCDIPA